MAKIEFYRKFIIAGIFGILASILLILHSTQPNRAITSFEPSMPDHVELSGPVSRAAQLSKSYAEFKIGGRQRGYLPPKFLFNRTIVLVVKLFSKTTNQQHNYCAESEWLMVLLDNIFPDQNPNRVYRKKLPEIILPCGK